MFLPRPRQLYKPASDQADPIQRNVRRLETSVAYDMLTILASIVLGVGQVKVHDVQAFRGFEVQGVAATSNKDYIRTCLRVRGNLPAPGLWSLKVLSVKDGEDAGNPLGDGLTGASDVSTAGYGPFGSAAIKNEPAPNSLRLECELIHYLDIEETAQFPEVKLVTRGAARAGSKPMRDWFVRDGDDPSAITERGLVLRFAKGFGYGYSGPGYDDLSRLPVKVDVDSLNKGVEAELIKFRDKSVERVDAYVKPGRLVQIYSVEPKIENGMFAFFDREFSQDVALSLHVIRRIADRRLKFNLVLPVQRDKETMEEGVQGADASKSVVWPSLNRPVRSGVIPPK